MRRCIGLILLMLFSAVSLNAQESTPTYTAPTIEFAPEIEITNSEIVEDPVWSNALRYPRMNTTNRAIEGYDWDLLTYRSYPYPEGVVALFLERVRSDGTWILSLVPYETESPLGGYYVFDPRTGEYQEPEIVCGTVPPLPDENPWQFRTDLVTQERSLCNTLTGERYTNLPEEVNEAAFVWAGSPDGRWVLWLDGVYELDAYLYAYDLTTSTLNNLGLLRTVGRLLEIDQWVDNEKAVMYKAWAPVGYMYEVFRFDVTQADSLQHITTGKPTYYQNPSRYEILEYASEDEPLYKGVERCRIWVYLLDADQMETYDLAQSCYHVQRADDGNYVFLSFNDDGTTSLTKLNPLIGISTEYIRGDMTWLSSISPSGRYAIVGEGNGVPVNKQLGRGAPTDAFGMNYNVATPPERIRVYDFETRDYIYEFGYEPGVNEIKWRGDAKFLFTKWVENTITLYRVNLQDEPVTRYESLVLSPLIDPVSPDGNRILIPSNGIDARSGISVLDLATNEILPLIADYSEGSCMLSINWLDNERLQVEFNYYIYVRITPTCADYRVQLPE